MINNIIMAIDQIATSDPARIAYDYLGETNTYGDLKRRSDAWAHYLEQLQLPAGSPIMIWGEQTFEMVASFLGCIKSGHAYIPIASYSNAERLAMIARISQSPAVIAIEELPDIVLDKVKIIQPNNVPAGKFNIDLAKCVQGDDDFYLLFTSGTSGEPKGVQISCNNLLSFINWELSDFDLPKRPIFLAQVPYSFDLSVMSIYPALVTGGKLVSLPHKVTQDFGQLFTIMPKLHFDVWVSTPSFAQMCLLDGTFNEEHHPELTHMLFCGEELPHAEVASLKKRFPNVRIFNTYGPTETTVAVSQVEITPEIMARYDRLPIGKVKADTQITIDHPDQNGIGEIIITGPSVSKGYLNNPEKTEKGFFHDKLARYPSHRSGDRGFFDGDLLFYRGRIDFQIKFNGYRIELEEINHYLDQNDLVRYGVVAPKYTKDHTIKQLVAEIELNDGASEQYTQKEITQKIRVALAKQVMPYMIPQRFVYQDKLPISQNGKVDIKAVIKEVNS